MMHDASFSTIQHLFSSPHAYKTEAMLIILCLYCLMRQCVGHTVRVDIQCTSVTVGTACTLLVLGVDMRSYKLHTVVWFGVTAQVDACCCHVPSHKQRPLLYHMMVCLPGQEGA